VSHLGWSDGHAQGVIAEGITRDMILRQGNLLLLTQKGRAEARAILEPWRQG